MVTPIWKVVDANFNRAREGLRVCEDIVRFAARDSVLTKLLKAKRHDLARLLTSLPVPECILLRAREANRDVGNRSFIRSRKKPTWSSMLSANFKRAEEALRVLEECSLVAAPKMRVRFQAMRFNIYELEKRTLSQF